MKRVALLPVITALASAPWVFPCRGASANPDFGPNVLIWNGDGGRVCFYQSEMPYDPPSQEAWRHGAVTGYASYKAADTVTAHEAWGLGVYCVFHE